MINSNQHPGLYIHVPFCKSKCAYCDFYSVTDADLVFRWSRALQKEILLYSSVFSPFDTLYLGGGTPSFLPDRILSELIDCVRNHFPISAEAETTLEANPDDLSPAKLKLFRALGFNRLSLGAQSFDDSILKSLKRRHTVQQTLLTLEWARRAGFDNIGLDLIYAVPGQNVRAWLQNLACALECRPEHLSCYQLTLEPETLLGRQVAQGSLELFDDEQARRFFLETSLTLTEAGYLHYEISNFAKDHAHVSRHNMKYWRHTPYLGLGPAAHSLLGKKRWWNRRDLKTYCADLENGRPPVAGSENLNEEQWDLETLYLGFRTRRGLNMETLEKYQNHREVIRRLRESSLVEQRDGRLFPTLDGFAVADGLPLLFA